MSRFYASIQGNRSEATRQGTAKSGIIGHVRGWHAGIEVIAEIDPITGRDTLRVYKTGGSAGDITADRALIGELIGPEDKPDQSVGKIIWHPAPHRGF